MGLTPRPERVQFRDRHKGETVYVLASGPSLNHINPAFFADKTVVAVNYIGLELGLPRYYMVSHYHLDAIAVSEVQPDTPIIVPEYDQGGTQLAPHAPTGANVWGFPTNQQRYAAFNVDEDWPTEPDSLAVGPTSLHMTMHFAHYLGAASIVLVGADCGTLDGAENRNGHDRGIGSPWPVWAEMLPRVADKLRSLGSDVYSLNPFVNVGLEGHAYWSPTTRVNC
jgi:hypothetical protein